MKRPDLQKLGAEESRYLKQAGELAAELGVRAYMVGGAVRDLILGRPCLDMDIVVEGDGIAFARYWAGKTGAVVLAHQRFGTAVLTMEGGTKFDVVTARRESYRCPGALPDVRPGTLSEDLYRRDFTINALAVSILPSSWGIFHDEWGGLEDLRRGVVRIMHETSFRDDPTRMLRAVRYEKRFRFRMSRETLKAFKEAVASDRLITVAPVRYWNEFRRILEEEYPLPALQRLCRLGAMQFVNDVPAAVRMVGKVSELVAWCRDRLGLPVAHPWFIYCAALLAGSGKEESVRILTHYGVGREDKRKILELLHFATLPVMLDANSITQKCRSASLEGLILLAVAVKQRKLSEIVLRAMQSKG